MKLKPFFPFFGSKYQIAPKYPPPIFDTIIEPFAGSAGYSVRHHTKNVVLVDLDEKICATWEYLIRSTPEDIRCLPLTVETTIDDLKVCQEAKFLIGWWLNRGCTTPMKSPGRWMRDGTHTTSHWGRAVRERVANQVIQIKHWKVFCDTYKNWDNYGDRTWFVDPPYQVAGKRYRRSSKDIDFYDLSVFCRTRQGQVVVCENHGATWLPFREFMTTKATSRNNGARQSKEVVWTNDQ